METRAFFVSNQTDALDMQAFDLQVRDASDKFKAMTRKAWCCVERGESYSKH